MPNTRTSWIVPRRPTFTWSQARWPRGRRSLGREVAGGREALARPERVTAADAGHRSGLAALARLLRTCVSGRFAAALGLGEAEHVVATAVDAFYHYSVDRPPSTHLEPGK